MTRPHSLDAPLALALHDIDKRYGTVQALEAASLEVRPGTIHALLGENGAGKSTLMRIAYGLERADAGTLVVHNEQVRFTSAAEAIAHGIGMVHQHFALVPSMTVAENLALGGHGRLDLVEVAKRIEALSAETGFDLDPQARVETLAVGAQQRVEIAKALVRSARILVLDEPTAVLAPVEATELLRWLRAYADAGNAAVLITHKLREALGIADDVTVLRRGRTVLAAKRDDVTPETLTTAMIGEEIARATMTSNALGLGSSAATEPVFRAVALTVTDARGIARIVDATFEVGAGEIVGIAAVEGSGQRELLRALAGRLDATSGTLSRPDVVGFVPEDRHHDAVLLNRSLSENVALHGAGARRGMIDWNALRAQTERLMQAYDVRAESTNVQMRTLSGGNQQKLVLARELGVETGRERALVVENPTRGLDVRATAEVHARLRTAALDGAAIVLYSSDIDEVLLVATRVLVVFERRVREMPLDRERIGQAMVGAA
jgi:general nucleoside transport system ATP-binding protein